MPGQALAPTFINSSGLPGHVYPLTVAAPFLAHIRDGDASAVNGRDLGGGPVSRVGVARRLDAQRPDFRLGCGPARRPELRGNNLGHLAVMVANFREDDA